MPLRWPLVFIAGLLLLLLRAVLGLDFGSFSALYWVTCVFACLVSARFIVSEGHRYVVLPKLCPHLIMPGGGHGSSSPGSSQSALDRTPKILRQSSRALAVLPIANCLRLIEIKIFTKFNQMKLFLFIGD